jgi:dTDP-4-amino-4,6-dideoxygalactose transaminase
MKDEIRVTLPSLPPIEDYISYLEKIWSNGILTNCGPIHQEFEIEIGKFLGVKNLNLVSSGTAGLQLAIKALNLCGEIITTPFSFVATSSAIAWAGIKPIFVDIDPVSLNINPSLIEKAITSKTTAILAVHSYGIPCDVLAIQKIATQYGLKVIYDAAHAFGIEDHSGSILNYGDVSVLSLHSTKVFHTIEGGAVVTNNEKLSSLIRRQRNFGIVGDGEVDCVGLNFKMNEFCSAMGHLQLKMIYQNIALRKNIDTYYKQQLQHIPGIEIIDTSKSKNPNFSYFPIRITDQYNLSRDEVWQNFSKNDITTRRYFYPIIPQLDAFRFDNLDCDIDLPNAKKASNEILCLPIYPKLPLSDTARICNLLKTYFV